MILGIESSCDESAIAIVDSNGQVKESGFTPKLRNMQSMGAVPDLAVGEHLKNFFPLLDLARTELSMQLELGSVAVTCGPGLAGCLGVGITIAKTLSLQWGIPVNGVNHL